MSEAWHCMNTYKMRKFSMLEKQKAFRKNTGQLEKTVSTKIGRKYT